MFVKSTTGSSLPEKQSSQSTITRCIPQSTNLVLQTFISPVEQLSRNRPATSTEGFCNSYAQLENEPAGDIGLGLGDVSMTFLSQSLK